jgi:hypothetical protein
MLPRTDEATRRQNPEHHHHHHHPQLHENLKSQIFCNEHCLCLAPHFGTALSVLLKWTLRFKQYLRLAKSKMICGAERVAYIEEVINEIYLKNPKGNLGAKGQIILK